MSDINPFEVVMSKKSNAELRAIIDDKEGFRLEAREAAIQQLELRNEDVGNEEIELKTLKSNLSKEADTVKERSRRKERFFYFPKKAPNSVKVIGGIYYALLLLSVGQFLYSLFFIFREYGFSLFALIFPILIYGFFAFMIDGIVKGKLWARTLMACLIGLYSLIQILTLVFTVSIFRMIDAYSLLIWLIYVITCIFLYIEPSKYWFKKEIRNLENDLLDD